MAAVDSKPASRRCVGAWIAIAADTIVPLAVGAAAVLMFALLEQSRDALFGALGRVKNVAGGTPRVEGISQFYAYAGAVLLFGNLLWYGGRILGTTLLLAPPAGTCADAARTRYPRYLASFIMSTLMAVPVFLAYRHRLVMPVALAIAVASALLPCVIFIVVRKWRKVPHKPWPRAAAILMASFLGEWALMMGVEGTLHTQLALSGASVMPMLFYILWVERRKFFHLTADPYALRTRFALPLLGFGIGAATIFLTLAWSSAIPRWLGSPAIAMIALNGFLVGLVTTCLVLRAIQRKLPGLVAVGALSIVAALVLFRLAYKIEPWREVPGLESLKVVASTTGTTAKSAPADTTTAHDIVVNAYGGGLRAAFYTALFLAYMDDRSCGRFGERLTALSGVSGGSLGIATYLIARERVMAKGGWRDCDGRKAVVGSIVEDVLRQDHLSAVVARMLTVDLIPFMRPDRGQALLESWDTAIRTATGSGDAERPVALGMPLGALDGGPTAKPLVLFNATDAVTGQVLWMSNRGRWGRQHETAGQPIDLQLGQAVLHSARFPLVSPVGSLKTKAGQVFLVDGGLADVSGASTLAAHVSAPRHWISIDGNFRRTPCDQKETPGMKTWSTLNALLGVRTNQAAIGMTNMGNKIAKEQSISASLDFYVLHSEGTSDSAAACAKIARLHMAPLGWYMSVPSAEDMKPAVRYAAQRACEKLGSVCKDPVRQHALQSPASFDRRPRAAHAHAPRQ